MAAAMPGRTLIGTGTSGMSRISIIMAATSCGVTRRQRNERKLTSRKSVMWFLIVYRT
jgi:hypothetical protein